MPYGRKYLSRYQPLFDLLAAATGDEVALTYKEVAALIGRHFLLETATLHLSWWTNKRQPHVQTWRAMGWIAHADRDTQRVVFTRAAEEGSE